MPAAKHRSMQRALSSKVSPATSPKEVGYVVDKRIGHIGLPNDRRYTVQWDAVASEDDAVEPAHHIPNDLSCDIGDAFDKGGNMLEP